ncbi:MAG: glycerol-3-phosphate dehydrogenase [Alphaproteobacteria bacterium]|nr:glycerol-3-phosphate dehydrogenase [Alphaproteobacteria bacterium]
METDANYDILIVGGGINGCGIARDAAGRGFSVCLCEAEDLASGTSSGSTKLIHGGLRYLEHYHFRLVREALIERELLWKLAPHIIRPLRFVLPHHRGLRPAWLLRLGLFIYDHIGGRKLLPPSHGLDLTSDPAGEALKPEYRKAFEYSDCWVDDARLVVLNARDAAGKGAIVRTRTRVLAARPDSGRWSITLQTKQREPETATASVLVNAGGPWVDEVLKSVLGRRDAHRVRLVRGSHIVVPKCFEHDRCYVFQNADGRIVFAIPYERDYTLIGTTDIDHEDICRTPQIAADEIQYLCDMASDYLRQPVTPEDVVWSYSAVRPLYDDGSSRAQEATRDYVVDVETVPDAGMLVNVFGGKVTTHRRLAEAAVDRITGVLGKRGPKWTASAPFPGGDFPVHGLGALLRDCLDRYAFVDPDILRRLTRLYGTEIHRLLAGKRATADLGRHFGAGLYDAEIDFLVAHEWAQTAEDVLFRRTKLGLRMTPDQIAAVEARLAATVSAAAPPADMAPT